MYSNIYSVQALIGLLREYGVRYAVLSPGGSDVPIIHSMENDSYFTCFSVVDERSAVYFALGLAQVKNCPVACVCTSGSAVCNYLPGITEAFYQSVPLIAITADKNPYYQGQLETQKIEQSHMFDGVVKKSVSLPLIYNEDDKWLCRRMIHEALLEMTHHGSGPVHINIPIAGDIKSYNAKMLSDITAIRRISPARNVAEWQIAAKDLAQAKKIMILLGQNIVFSEEDRKRMNQFFVKFNCIYAVEHLSNADCDGLIHTYPVTEMKDPGDLQDLVPDIVITLGNNLSAYNLKTLLRGTPRQFRHWLVNETGNVRDIFRRLSRIFECTPGEFFKIMLDSAPEDAINDREYFSAWNEMCAQTVVSQFEFTNFYVGKRLSEIIPDNSLLHTAILNSTRVMQFFPLANGVKSYSNVGTLGIDGCCSTFIGQAANFDNLAFLLIGDLSFFYDMNAVGIRHIGNNVRIILLNNGGGAEFHFFVGKDAIPTINRHICAEHRKSAEGWITSLGFRYFAARNREEFDARSGLLAEYSDSPIFLEVFTDMERDAELTRQLYQTVKHPPVKRQLKGGLCKMANAFLSDKQGQKLKDIIQIIRK